MTVLMLLEHDFPPDIRVEKEVASLLKAGYKLIIACSNRTCKNEIEKVGDLTIIRRQISPFIYKSSVGCLTFPFYFQFWRSFLGEVVHRYNIDVIHVHDLPLAKIALELRKKIKTTVIIDSHENYPYMLMAASHTKTFLGKLLFSAKQWLNYEKKMLQSADIVLSIVQEQKERFIALGLDKSKVYLVSNTPEPVSLNIVRKTCSSGFIYVYAGNIYRSKGIEIMIKAFRIVAETVPKAKLWIIGNVQKLNSRFQLITEADKDKIVCWGWQPLGVLYDLIIKADVALLPHLKNLNSDYGIPNKLFQYMMVGKPVITSNCIPIERIIRETGAGLGYEYDNVKDLAEKMIYMFKNRTEINNLGKKGREAVLRKYNWKAEETNLLAAYNHVHMIRQNKKKE